jgi:uncharacterized DUF497 family protein
VAYDSSTLAALCQRCSSKWDEAKAAANAEKHGVTFQEASSVFGDPRPECSPTRRIAPAKIFDQIGYSDQGRLLLVVSRDRADRILRSVLAAVPSREDGFIAQEESTYPQGGLRESCSERATATLPARR